MPSSDNKGTILAFCCNWAPYHCFMEMTKKGHALPYRVLPIKVMCAGRLDPAILFSAFERGAAGVVVISCKERECHYGPGPEQAKKLTEKVQGIMFTLGLELERFKTAAFSSHESERFIKEMQSFTKGISRLGNTVLATR